MKELYHLDVSSFTKLIPASVSLYVVYVAAKDDLGNDRYYVLAGQMGARMNTTVRLTQTMNTTLFGKLGSSAKRCPFPTATPRRPPLPCRAASSWSAASPTGPARPRRSCTTTFRLTLGPRWARASLGSTPPCALLTLSADTSSVKRVGHVPIFLAHTHRSVKIKNKGILSIIISHRILIPS
jgi:hypothetical protein